MWKVHNDYLFWTDDFSEFVGSCLVFRFIDNQIIIYADDGTGRSKVAWSDFVRLFPSSATTKLGKVAMSDADLAVFKMTYW